jgi:hypothetical protein
MATKLERLSVKHPAEGGAIKVTLQVKKVKLKLIKVSEANIR